MKIVGGFKDTKTNQMKLVFYRLDSKRVANAQTLVRYYCQEDGDAESQKAIEELLCTMQLEQDACLRAVLTFNDAKNPKNKVHYFVCDILESNKTYMIMNFSENL